MRCHILLNRLAKNKMLIMKVLLGDVDKLVLSSSFGETITFAWKFSIVYQNLKCVLHLTQILILGISLRVHVICERLDVI